jgi:hypothetical protein
VVSDVEKAHVMRQVGDRETIAVDVSRVVNWHQNVRNECWERVMGR